jgi:hypothetical protein
LSSNARLGGRGWSGKGVCCSFRFQSSRRERAKRALAAFFSPKARQTGPHSAAFAIKIPVRANGRCLGILNISKGAIDWVVARAANYGRYSPRPEAFDALTQEQPLWVGGA